MKIPMCYSHSVTMKHQHAVQILLQLYTHIPLSSLVLKLLLFRLLKKTLS